MGIRQLFLVSFAIGALWTLTCQSAPVDEPPASDLFPPTSGFVPPASELDPPPFQFNVNEDDVRAYELTPEEIEELRTMSEDAVRSGNSELPVVEERSFLSMMNHIWDFLGFRRFQKWLAEKRSKSKKQHKFTAPTPVHFINNYPHPPPYNAGNYPRSSFNPVSEDPQIIRM